MSVQKKRPVLLALSAAGMFFALMAAKCETDFPPYVQELCDDSQDNDEDGLTDCQDSDCASACAVDVAIIQPSPTDSDSLLIMGTSRRAASVSITVSPSGSGGQATLQAGGGWEFMIRNINQIGLTHTVRAVASSAEGLTDTAMATFVREP